MSVTRLSHLQMALPYWVSLLLLPLPWIGATQGGWTVFLVPLGAWVMFSVIDWATGLDNNNVDPETPDRDLILHRLVTWLWPPLQVLTVFGVIAILTRADLTLWEVLAVTIGLGILGGTIGIVYGHELMHQSSRFERWLGDLLMTSVMYGHFRSEHLLVHHRYVATPRDAVTARYNENFHAFFLRVLPESLVSAVRAEAAKLAKSGRSPWALSNPFWRYGALQAGFLIVAYLIGGWAGLGLYLLHALVAVWQLELVNYIEHYGLTRKHLGDGKYEPVAPHHSWNASHRGTNWLLINLQRHSDHHYKPARRFPLLQTYAKDEAPQLPFGYPVMGALAMVPALWRRRMNPRVKSWRQKHYPEVGDWQPYTEASLPMPK